MVRSFHRAVRAETLAEGALMPVVINGWPVLLARSEGKPYATLDRCPHAGSALSPGRLRRGVVMCPLHGARFDISTGHCIGGSYDPLMTFETRVEDDWIAVAVPDTPPGFEHMPIRARG